VTGALTAGAFIFALAIVIFLLEPILTGRHAIIASWDSDEETAFRTHAALRALRDVEYDFATGKLDDQDYKTLKRELVAEAADFLEGAGLNAPPTDSLEEEIQAMRIRIADGEVCGGCGAGLSQENRFCAVCGRPVREGAA